MDKNQDDVWVIKSTGERERFSLNKLRRSLTRSGADDETIERIVEHILPELHEGMKTSQIYKHAYSILKKNKYPAAIRYSLRKAVLELGPSGFPFEKFVAEVLRGKGYTAQTGVILPGFCVDHEVDVLMEKDNRHIFAECKFHNQQGIKTDVKVALYVHARFMDLQKAHDEAHKRHEGEVKKVHEGWLITNTKLTSDAIEYANCAGLTVIGWDYPEKGNLQDLILETGVHPLTFLSTLTQSDKNSLLEQGIVMCRDLKNSPAPLKSIGFTDEQIGRVVEEVDQVCQEF
ncbi:MAG: ATP-cone domain protein [Parcubacteria group bacterium GW2011_GWA1_44_13]|uniref:ATP-cone domain protein n=1 Tax=Candidatus Nomurabacteria bacterium GW2011_GWB1_44_12 TaxID=1618748 RepID=A0A837I7E5_9BACT|nr:MAG: ATP-cone domain protein [Candidatus Nomurabacteria bacterium GW2011_GWB1_44_12]KKT38074.1 MAG: ATP-cone domain protein [Parcubacteria group bacterium GW2011_GWA1_44_13]HBB44349.1 ATPase [Candidatus Yonathbacteria bacterium]